MALSILNPLQKPRIPFSLFFPLSIGNFFLVVSFQRRPTCQYLLILSLFLLHHLLVYHQLVLRRHGGVLTRSQSAGETVLCLTQHWVCWWVKKLFSTFRDHLLLRTWNRIYSQLLPSRQLLLLLLFDLWLELIDLHDRLVHHNLSQILLLNPRSLYYACRFFHGLSSKGLHKMTVVRHLLALGAILSHNQLSNLLQVNLRFLFDLIRHFSFHLLLYFHIVIVSMRFNLLFPEALVPLTLASHINLLLFIHLPHHFIFLHLLFMNL